MVILAGFHRVHERGPRTWGHPNRYLTKRRADEHYE